MRRGFHGLDYERVRGALRAYDDRFDDYWGFLEPRLVEAWRLLSPQGTLYLHLDYPSADREKAIVLSRVPEIAEQLAGSLVSTVRALRAMELKKSPSISESIDWARTLLALGLDTLDEEAVRTTLGVVLKHASDHDRATTQLKLN